MWMEMLDLIHYRFFFTGNSLECQPTTSLFILPLTQLMLALVAAAIHCALSDFATGNKVTVMLSQDEYQGILCPSKVIDGITAKATALLINFTWWAAPYFLPNSAPTLESARFDPHQQSSLWIGTSIFPSAHLSPLSDLDVDRLNFIPDSFHPFPPLLNGAPKQE
jgi:hypothetical protein